MIELRALAPTGEAIVDYDRDNLALYAALLDAADAGEPWQDAATTLMRIDTDDDGAEECWRSHLDRARWIIGEGLGSAIVAFGSATLKTGESGASHDRAAHDAERGKRSAH